MNQRSDVTRLLRQVSDGTARAADELLPLVYDELRALARRHLRQERRDHTLSATALVHEVYLKLVNQDQARFEDRAHFFAVAAQAMRRVLVDHARRRKRKRRGGPDRPVTLHDVDTIAGDAGRAPDLSTLDRVLTRLAGIAPDKARVVEMRVFAGLSTEEIAAVLEVSPRTVRRYWEYARTWMYRELGG
jgi:RNA polymerase sigma factor (TIGR02999 family)